MFDTFLPFSLRMGVGIVIQVVLFLRVLFLRVLFARGVTGGVTNSFSPECEYCCNSEYFFNNVGNVGILLNTFRLPGCRVIVFVLEPPRFREYLETIL